MHTSESQAGFFSKADGQAGGQVGNDVTFSNYITFLHVIRPCELVFMLDLHFFHSVAVGLAILCSQHWILVNLNALTITFIEI